jgi:nucleotide-binding universal stress UspA family protein
MTVPSDDRDRDRDCDRDELFAHALVPVADPKDAATTATSVLPRVLNAGGRITVVNVIEKAGGAPDKASVEQRELEAEAMFEAVEAAAVDTGVLVETQVAYGTDVAETVFDVAAEVGATCVAFTPRDGGRLLRLLTGDTALDLVTKADRPVVVLPDQGSAADESENRAENDATGGGAG